jgi:hypothetical protein
VAAGDPTQRDLTARPGPSPAAVGQRDRTIAIVCALLLLIGMPVGYLGDDPGTGDVIGLFVMTALSLALMALIFLRLLSRDRSTPPERASRTALILGLLAVLTVLVFWTGLPFPLGAGAIALGLSLTVPGQASRRSGRVTAAVALGGVGVAAAFVLLLFG